MDDGKPSSHPPMVGGEDDMDVGDCSEEGEEEDEEEEEIEMGSSPLEDHGSLMMALASSNVLPYEGLASPLRLASSGGKPLGLRRGPGRPPRRGTPPHSSRQKKPLGLKLKRWRGSVYMPSDKSPRHSMDGDTMLDGGTERGVDGSPAHSSEPNTPALSSDDKHDKFSQPSYVSDEPPYFQETWPGKVCSLCNLSERTQLGQGEMIKVTCPEGFTPQKKDVDPGIMSPPNDPDDSLLGADKSPRCSTAPALSYRRQKSWSKSRNSSINGQEPLDELAIIGYTEEPDLTNLFEHSNDQWVVYVHESCSLWSLGISRPSDTGFQAIGQIVINASVKKCSSCNKFGASTVCTFSGCTKYFHLPCAAASGCFQDAKSYALVCNVHLHHVPLMPNLRDVTCMSCYSLGDVSNLVMCSMCGNNYHGSCVGLALLPGARAGWQCTDCRMCQVCRQPEDSKIMVCETCDKAYHPHCLRPIVTTVPKYGWKCKCCRLCSDCGSRTPGAGQSSRWHAHYTVCDSCYQQRNKGFSCPLCRRAYRAAAYREMVQCSKCKKFVHGTCDLEADLATYQLKKETTPDYEYVCPNCKSGIQNALKRKDSTEDFCMDSNMSASQESLLLDEFDFDCDKEGFSIGIGLGKGKPFSASKIAKKKLGLGCGLPGRPGKGLGKISGISLSVMSSYQKKHQRCNEFGRKRIPKAKMRGIFGVPGLGLQRPQADTTTSKSDEEPGGENRLVLCSAKDKFVLTQDMCVMCGALGTDQEGCLIACAQCGQCYHPYCVSVKVTKVILQKGWRCLDCTVCEGCGLKNDEARLILCDDCDISFHIYCMDPPLSYVPRGTWKCKWCAQCLTCGVNNPGFNCVWLRNYTECGPCASRTTCPSCAQCYGDGELIIKCIQCERWLHCLCDQIRDENEAEFCAEEGYTCVLCRPRDVKPPHLLPGVFQSKPRPLSPPGSPDYTKLIDKDDFYVVDGVKLSESGLHQIRALTIEQQVQPRKKRSGPRRHHGFGDKEISRPPTFTDKEASVLATIESVVAGVTDCGEDVDEDSITIKEEVSRYKEGMEVTPRPDGRAPEPPEGFSIYTTESGIMVLRRKRQRNLQRLGIGGFNARLRQTRCRDKEEESGAGDGVPATTPTTPGGSDSATTPTTPGITLTGGPDDKPRRKPQRRKPKSKLVENYPSYLQEAFFGRDLLDTSKDTSQDLPSSSDESEDGVSRVSQDKTITLSQDELKVMEQMKIKQEKECDQKKSDEAVEEPEKSPIKQEEDDGSDSEALKDILHLPDNLLDTDLVNTIMTEGDGDIKSEDALMADSSLADDAELNRSSSPPPKDELSDILGPHFNLESMVRETGLPNMDCKDVEDIFKGVLTDESQESQESSSVFPGAAPGGIHPQSAPPIMSPHSVIQNGMGLVRQPGSTLPSVVHSNLPSPITYPSASPYHSEYSNSPQFSPAFSEPPSPWADDGEGNGGPHSHYNQRNTLKMEADETLANNATISCVLYANINHPEWKKEYPSWAERSKQILKKWRALPSEKKAPYLQQARDNRANLRMKKAQQEQDKLQQQQKTCREAEQERQWKQMQALRQQQAAQQQQVMQDQRAQAASRVHRQLSGDGGVLQMNSEPQSHLTSQLQVSTVQDSGSLPSMTSPGGVRTSQQFPSPVGLKAQHVGSPVIPNYPRSGTPALPIRGVVNPPTSQDPFAPPRQMQPIVHPAGVQGQEMNRQLRDLLQRQHIKNKLESEQMIQQRVWPLQEEQGMGTSPTDSSGTLSLLSPVVSQSQSSINYEPNNPVPAATNSPTFRHPLPPSLARPTRLPLQQGQMIIRGQRMPQFSDPRMQGVDPRVRLLLQQQQRPGFSPNNQMIARISGPRNPLDPYDHLVQQRPEFQDGPGSNIVRQMPSNLCNNSSRIQSPAQNPALEQQRIAVNSGGDSREEIPESVTAELEKLEQEEGSTIPEVENVGAILGDLVEDDDELLAEMGADFNILEYADPELDTVTGGEKTNILDVDLEEEDTKKDNASINNRSEKKEDVTPRQDPTPSAPGDKVTNDSNVDKKPLNNLPSESTQSSTNQSSLPLMTMSPSNNTVPPLSQSSQNSMVGGVLTQSSGGIVATVSYPATFPVANQPLPRIQHIGQVAAQQQQRLQQLQRLGGGPRVVSVGPGGQILPPQAGQPSSQQGLVNSSPGLITATNTLMSPTGTARLAPPPPPYPGPPPPYPGPIQQGGFRGLTPPLGTPTQRRPLLLQEQPLLLEDLLEQEKREQEKQASVEPAPATALLSDADFERLRADVLGTSQGNVVASPPHGLPAQGILPAPGLVGQSPALRPQFVPRPPTQQPQWQQSQPTIVRTPVLQQETTLRVPLFNAPVLPPPTPPPDIIVTEQDRQQQLHYETWLNNQNHIVTQQLKYYETEVQKLRKIRKSLNSKQRQLRKNGNELAENDAMELQRVTAEQAVLQKQLESSRKQSRQHGVLIQEYRNKQQANKVVRPGGLNTPLLSSPSGSSPQSPLLTSPSPGPLSVSQQQSPRIGTPHSQGDDNPFSPGTPGTSDILRSLPSPSRLTSPSPRGITSPRAPNPPPPSSTPRPNVGSPGSFTVQDQSIRPLGMPPRFVRSPESGGLRPRAVGLPLQVPGPTSSPAVYQGPRNVGFTSNPQPIMTAINDNKMVRLGGLTPQQQQMLLRQQLHQQRQALLQQQQELTQEAGGLRQIAQQRLEQQQQQQQQGEGPTPQQRQIQLVHQKQALLQQQELLQQQLNEPNLTPQQRQQIMQQRQALIHQSTEIAVQEKAVRLLLQNQEGIEGSNINRQQFQMLQHRQQQLAQQTRQQLILSQQGKTGQFRQMIQQQQGPQQQSPSRSPMGQFGQTSPMPSPIVQHFSGTPTSPMPPQSPIQQGQFPGSSPMHPQSPMVNQTQSSSPILPQSPIGVQQQFNQPNNSPMHSQSPMLQQYSNQNTPNSPMPPHSPRVQQQFSNQTPSSPMTPQSPMLQNPNYQHQVTTPPMQPYNQPPNSPMQSPRMQPQYGQPPSSPITPQSPLLQQNQFVHRPNSPMPPKSPMPPMGSPMPMRRPSSTGGSIASSPQIPDRPQSVENPLTPRTPQDYEGGGGGNPHNPMNPIPFPSGFGRFGYIKLGLRGGSPMWGSDRQPPRKPSGQKINRDGSGPSKSEHSINAISALKTGSLVSLDYNEFEDDSSRNSSMTPPAKMLQKKQQIIEVQEQPSKPSDDNELTVYDDIVLVESCKDETNLEVEELQSSLESNVMSMPMVLDSGHMQISDMNLGSGNVEGQLLEECLVSSTDLVVLDVEPSESEECLLDMVEKDHMDSGGQDLLILEDDIVERESRDDESDVIELMDESSSPPTGRKRMAGKVLPGETLRKVQEKRDSTTDTPESPDQDESHADPLSETDNELISPFENTEKSETVSTTTPEGYHLRDELKTKTEETKNNFPVMASSAPPSSMHQANIGIPGLTRQTMSYPTFPRNPSFPRHVLPIIKSDGRPVFAVQATVANLVQDAVNAAKLAAEKKNLNHGVSLSGGVVIPNILSTPSTIASLGVVSTTCSTLIGPPRMSVPFSSGGRVTVTTAPTGTHYVPILSQSDKLGLLKIEGIKVINQKIELSDKSSDKLSDKQMPKITSAMLITSHPSNESASTSDRIFQRRYFEDKFKSDIKSTGSTKSEDLRPATPQIPTPTKFHNYSKVLVKTSDRQLSPGKQGQDMDSESRRSEITQRSEGPENLSTQNSIIIKNYSNESVRHTGVICNKRSSIDLTSSTSSSHTSSVITQVSVISDNKSAMTPPSLQDNLYKSEGNVQTSEESGNVSSSILEAQLTATCNRDDLIPRTPSAASPSKTLFSFLDNVTAPNKDKPQIREPQSVSVNMSNISLPFDDQKIHTEGMTLYRSSENITAHSNIPHMFKSTQSISELKLPTSVSEFKNMQEDTRIMSQPAIFSQSVRRIGNIYVHSQNVKSESNIHQSESPTGKDNDSSDQKQTLRNVSVLYSTDQSFQNQSKDTETATMKTDLSRTSSMTDLLRSGQKRETVFERQINSESREIEKINLERHIGSSKSMPSRLGELISGSASVQAHIERRISIAGQTDLMSNRNVRFFQKEESQCSDNLQQRTVSSSESSTSVMFTSGAVQRENVTTESNTTPTQFIPLSSMLTPKIETDDKLIRISSHSVPRISEESQNVLLKQLLQNTACATTVATPTTPVNTLAVPPPLSTVETQRIVATTTTVVAQNVEPTQKIVQSPVTTQSSTVPVPKVTTPPTPQNNAPATSIKTPQESPQPEVRRMSTGTPTSAGTPTSTLDELLSPTSSCSMPQTSPIVIKREPMLTPSQIKREPIQQTMSVQPMTITSPLSQKSPVMVEVKKEIISSDEMISPSLRHQENSDVQMLSGNLEQNSNMPLDPQDIKKLKRRQYQQKRRQSQGKDAIGGTPKKRPRKNSKVEEDYDSFIDALMVQLRQTPAMSILEPSLSRNYTVCPIFGSGDLSKVSCNTRLGDLKGMYGSATLSTESDYYNTQPYGDLLPVPPQSTPSTQRGFYNEEFAPLKLDTCKDELDERKLEFNRDRDNDTPDTIVSSSSPECFVPEIPIRYPGLRLIEDDDSDEDERLRKRGSPVVPLFVPQPIKPKSNRFFSEMDKENQYGDHALIKTRLSPSIPLKDSGNVTVTLTLTSAAADDVLGVLRNLANVLRIPAPTAFHITERTATPPSHKLGLYRCKGKDGKEGAPIDIQSILNGAAKFCRHCDVVILNNLIKKKASEMPFLAREEGSEDLYFCSSACYMQLALLHHPPSISKDKAAAIVDHLSQNDPSPPKKTRLTSVSEAIGEIKKKSVKSDLKHDNFLSLKMDLDEVKTHAIVSSEHKEPAKKDEVIEEKKPRVKGLKYRFFNSNAVPPPASKHKKPTDKEMTDMLFRMAITVTPAKLPDDSRVCLFCHQVGDGIADGPARLLNYDVDKWVHLNCALWSDEVYETVNGALMNVETALQQSLTAGCTLCHRTGATLKCYKMRCLAVYHLACAVKDECIFYKNKTLYCNLHVPKNEKDNELTTLSVFRRVYVNRDENRQVASVMHHTEHNHLLRVGTLIFLNVGQLLPHQLAAFHTPNYIYPIGYKIIRFYWSMRVCNKRCRYVCSIHEANGRPEFRVLIQEPAQDDIELRDLSPRAVWTRILEPLSELRKTNNNVQVFPRFVSGEDLFGLTEPAIVKVLESLPGVETLTDYRFKYGRNPLLELPLAINPSGCARCEGKPKGQGQWKRAHTQRTGSASRPNFTPTVGFAGDAVCPYSKQFVHSKSSQYKKMKQEWRNNVYLARSKIQGLGLYAARDLEKHTMVIEYIGEIIRTELAESREKQYEAKNRGIYMFRLDEERVVDATLSGGLARYINHSCNPNCVAETVEVERDQRIIIFAKRRISRGEELAYDYKFDIEDDQHKIPCMCGAPNCRKWMN